MSRALFVAMLLASATATADKHFDRILAQAIEEAHAKGPTTPTKALTLWRTSMAKFGDGACHCARMVGFVEVDGELVEKRALCSHALAEDLEIELVPELLRLPGNYERWMD